MPAETRFTTNPLVSRRPTSGTTRSNGPRRKRKLAGWGDERSSLLRLGTTGRGDTLRPSTPIDDPQVTSRTGMKNVWSHTPRLLDSVPRPHQITDSSNEENRA